MRRRRRGGDRLPAGSLDHPPAGFRFEAGVVVASGWALFGEEPVSRVEAWLGDVYLGRARLGLPRPDVAVVHPAPGAVVCGFELRAGVEPPAADLEAELRVVATAVGGEQQELGAVPVTLAGRQAPDPRPPRAVAAGGAGDGLRVLAFSNVLTLGGAALHLYDLLTEARRQGRIEPTVVSAIDGPLRGDLEAQGVPVHLLGPLPLDDLEAYLDRSEEIAAWAAGKGFELVLVNTATALTLPGADVGRALGLPVVWLVHESLPPPLLWDGLGPGLREHAEAALAEAALAVFEAEATRRLYPAVAERSVTVPYGLDLAPIEAVREGFDRGATRRELGIDADADLAVCVGTVEPRKAQVQLARAFDLVAGRHPRAQLAFVGSDEGTDSAALAACVAASAHGERMRIVPRTPEVQRWIGAADLLVCASDVESLPKSVLEAMAWEKPVLATAVFGLPETIEHGADGWLCEPGDLGALAAGLDLAFGSDEETRRRIGTAARQLVLDRHDLGAYAEQISDLLGAATG
ncbi:MAG TPA: glycosyltransferase family 4 protein [Solirubrobacterales bacterium]|nr:glycosyltransferase family 4 protein [Solirubrobacterales bacterium]